MADPQDAQPAGSNIRHYLLADDGTFPNSRLPLLLYPAVLDPADPDPAAAFEQRFQANGWPGAWRNGVFGFHHYHSTAHPTRRWAFSGDVRGFSLAEHPGPFSMRRPVMCSLFRPASPIRTWARVLISWW